MQQQFIATVSGAPDTGVLWQVGGVGGGNGLVGTITTNGTYTAPSVPPTGGSVVVTAVSTADNSKSGSAQISVVAKPPAVTVSIVPTNATVAAGQTQLFTANISGAINPGVIWAVNAIPGGDATVGTVSPAGLYIAPASVPVNPRITVAAQSSYDSNSFASATVTITPRPSTDSIPTTVSYGVHGSLSKVNNATIDSRIAKLRLLGAAISRNDISWDTIESSQGARDWSNPDYYVNQLVANGIEPLCTLLGTPQWANGNADRWYIPYDTTNRVTGGDFESGNFTGWTQNAGDGSISDETSTVHGGGHAAKLTSGTSRNTYIKQTFTVSPATGYSVRYWVSSQGERYRVVDVTHDADIVAIKDGGNWGATYQQKLISFKAPAGTTQVDVYFYGPGSANSVYLDDVQMFEMTGSVFQTWKASYVSFITDAATRYHSKVHKWEVWNEAETSYFWKPLPDVQQYMELYSSAADAIHAVDPTAQVAIQMAELQGPSYEPRGDNFLQAFYDAGLAPDVVSFHAYTFNQSDPPTVTNAYNNFNDIAVIRGVMTTNGKSANKMWVTEFGWPTDRVTQAQQASYLGAALGMIRDTYSSYVSVAIIYELQEGDPHGLFDASGNAKEAVATVQAFLSGGK